MAAVHVIFRCLADIITYKNSQGQSCKIDFEANVNIARAQSILARLMVLVNVPFAKPSLGDIILDAMECLGPIIHSA